MNEIENEGMEVEEEKEETVEAKTEETSDIPKEIERNFCVKCGAEIFGGQAFCPKCGQKVGAKLEKDADAPGKAGNKKLLCMIGGVVVAVAVLAVITVLVRGVQAKEVTLNKDALTVKAGETATLTYTIHPDNTKNKTVSWETSNDSIAKVEDGTVTAINEGDCTITVTTKNGKTGTCTITVTKAGPDLQAIYNENCSSTYSTIASDGSYLTIDTNPNDKADYVDTEALLALYAVNDALKLPDSVINKMGATRALDGMQSYENDEVEVTWTYHPDSGLEVQYSLVD